MASQARHQNCPRRHRPTMNSHPIFEQPAQVRGSQRFGGAIWLALTSCFSDGQRHSAYKTNPAPDSPCREGLLMPCPLKSNVDAQLSHARAELALHAKPFAHSCPVESE